MARTIVALYDRADDAGRAVEDLLRAGVPRADISVVAAKAGGSRRDQAVDADIDADRGTSSGIMIGATLGGIGGAMVAMATLTIPGLGPVVAVGPIAAGLLGGGAGAVAGGLIGALTGLGVPEADVHTYAEGLERGGTLLLVHAGHADSDRISAVLAQNQPADVRTRGDADGGKEAVAGRGADWRTADWAPFEPGQGPMEVLRPQQQAEHGGGDPSRGAHPVAHAGEGRGADWQTTGQAPFDESAGPVTASGKPRDAGERSAADPAAASTPGTSPVRDNADVGQAGTSPGTRGAATAFGGIEREKARTQPAPAETKPGVKAP
ncbi:MAG TPA: hypothetical protein VD978_31695 [Azospirillum sp.]|nr:hypothetical protein [Azospirillum sp.]